MQKKTISKTWENITTGTKLETLRRGTLKYDEREPGLEIQLNKWYLTNQGLIYKAVVKYDGGFWFIGQMPNSLKGSLISFVTSEDSLKFLEDNFLTREVPKTHGSEKLIKALISSPKWNKEVANLFGFLARLFSEETPWENLTWGRCYYLDSSSMCKPTKELFNVR